MFNVYIYGNIAKYCTFDVLMLLNVVELFYIILWSLRHMNYYFSHMYIILYVSAKYFYSQKFIYQSVIILSCFYNMVQWCHDVSVHMVKYVIVQWSMKSNFIIWNCVFSRQNIINLYNSYIHNWSHICNKLYKNYDYYVCDCLTISLYVIHMP